MTTTVHSFTKLGFRTMPIGKKGYELVRGADGKKHIRDKTGKVISFKNAMPANWTQEYGSKRKEHEDAPLGGLICGALSGKQDDEIEVFALDCDNQLAWDMVTALHPDYKFRFESVKKPGGTVIYQLPEQLRDVHQYSINNDSIHLEYMAKRQAGANAMIYLPTTANITKKEIEKGSQLDYPPAQIIALVKSLVPRVELAPSHEIDSGHLNLPFNAPLVTQFVKDVRDAAEEGKQFGKVEVSSLVEKVYSVFTPKKFRGATHYTEKGWLHPNSPEVTELGSWSEYIVGISAIAGSDPSIDLELYTDFMQSINAQTDDPMPAKRFLTEVINPMVHQKAKINGKPIWKYDEKWDQTSHTIVNQYGETLEYFTLEDSANRFVEYNHTTKQLIEVQGVRSLRDQIYAKDTNPEHAVPSANIVKKLKLVRVEESIKAEVGISTDKQGHSILNTAEPVLPLRILRDPEVYTAEVSEDDQAVQAFNVFLAHLLNEDEQAILFMKQVLSYHGRHLEAIPVILYMVGVGGAGKSQFALFLELLFGANTVSRPKPTQVTSTYNDFLMNCAILVLTETSDAKPRDLEGIKQVLKTVTGEKTIDIETKYKATRRNVPVFCLPVLLANEPWYQEDTADRRLFSIIPKSTLIDSPKVVEFEQTHGVRITSVIEQGIKSGVIPKYLSTFCPKVLPEVPLTVDKQHLSMEQRDPIMVVKNLVATAQWHALFDMFDQYDIDSFFTAMEGKKLSDKNALFKQQLVDLTMELREGDVYTVTDGMISKAFTIMWLPKQAVHYRPRDKDLARKLGTVKWRVQIEDEYESWKLKQVEEESA